MSDLYRTGDFVQIKKDALYTTDAKSKVFKCLKVKPKYTLVQDEAGKMYNIPKISLTRYDGDPGWAQDEQLKLVNGTVVALNQDVNTSKSNKVPQGTRFVVVDSRDPVFVKCVWLNGHPSGKSMVYRFTRDHLELSAAK